MKIHGPSPCRVVLNNVPAPQPAPAAPVAGPQQVAQPAWNAGMPQQVYQPAVQQPQPVSAVAAPLAGPQQVAQPVWLTGMPQQVYQPAVQQPQSLHPPAGFDGTVTMSQVMLSGSSGAADVPNTSGGFAGMVQPGVSYAVQPPQPPQPVPAISRNDSGMSMGTAPMGDNLQGPELAQQALTWSQPDHSVDITSAMPDMSANDAEMPTMAQGKSLITAAASLSLLADFRRS